MKKIIAIIIVALVNTFQVYACSCIGMHTVIKAIKNSDLVIDGTVVSSKTIEVMDDNLPKGYKVKKQVVVIEVKKVYKGKKRIAQYEIVTGTGGGDCGYGFEIGERYIVYATRERRYFAKGKKVSSFYYTDICSRTASYSDGEAEELEKAK